MIQTVKRFLSDIDIDFRDRTQILKLIDHIPASMISKAGAKKHASGIYVTNIPQDPCTAPASIDYNDAEDRGYIKLDFLNVNLYKHIRDEAHLIELMREPDWTKLYDPAICAQLLHINAHYDLLIKMPEAVNSVARLAMFLAIIRPAKRHLIGKTWQEVANTVWDNSGDGKSYAYKRAHAISYSQLVVVNMNLLNDTGSLQDLTN